MTLLVLLVFCAISAGDSASLKEPPQIVPLKIGNLENWGNETIYEGECLQVNCFVVRGDEPLTLIWKLNGTVISSEPSISTTRLGTRSSMLTIKSVGYGHSGEYKCVARNPYGLSSRSVSLKVNSIVEDQESLKWELVAQRTGCDSSEGLPSGFFSTIDMCAQFCRLRAPLHCFPCMFSFERNEHCINGSCRCFCETDSEQCYPKNMPHVNLYDYTAYRQSRDQQSSYLMSILGLLPFPKILTVSMEAMVGMIH